MTAIAGQASGARPESRISASTKPTKRPPTSATEARWIVLRRPSRRSDALRNTAEKSHSYLKLRLRAAASGALRPQLALNRRCRLRIDLLGDEELVVELLRHASVVKIVDRKT